MADKIPITKLMQYLSDYAFIGMAAKAGMMISCLLLAISLFTTLPFNPLAGFILVPLACIFIGIKGLKRNETPDSL